MTDRSRLDWFVYSQVWEQFVEYGQSEYGEDAEGNGYLVRLIETAMREVLRNNRHAELEDKVHELVDLVGAKKTDLDEDAIDDEFEFSHQNYSEKTRVAKHVDTALLERWKAHADEFGETYGEHLSRTLAYFLWGGQPRTLTERVDRAIEEIERDQDDSMTTAEKIADRLDEEFRLNDFLEAAEASGVGTDKYALEQYLPKVLDELDVYPHPVKTELFVPADSATIPETPDPGTLPYQAMDDADKRLALKAAALRKVGETSTGMAKFSANDAVDALGGRPRHSTVRPLLEDIALDSDGFVYDDDIPGLRVDRADAVRADYDNEAALTIVGWLDEEPSDAEPSDGTDEWITEAADATAESFDENGDDIDKLPDHVVDNVVTNKIARVRYSDEVPDEGPPDEVLERITDRERELVKDELGCSEGTGRSFDAELSSFAASSIDAGQCWEEAGIGIGQQEAGADD